MRKSAFACMLCAAISLSWGIPALAADEAVIGEAVTPMEQAAAPKAVTSEAAEPETPAVVVPEVVAPKTPEVVAPTEPTVPEVPEVVAPTEPTTPEVPEVVVPTEPTTPETPEVVAPTEPTTPETPEVVVPEVPETPEVAAPGSLDDVSTDTPTQTVISEPATSGATAASTPATPAAPTTPAAQVAPAATTDAVTTAAATTKHVTVKHDTYTIGMGGFVWDTAGGATAAGTKMQLWVSNNTPAQHIEVIANGGKYQLRAVGAGRYITVDSKGNVVLGSKTDKTSLWDVIAEAGSTYLVWLANGQRVTVKGTPAKESALVLAKSGMSASVESCRAAGLSDGWYTFSPNSNGSTSKVVEVAGGNWFNSGNAQLWASNGTYAQRWKFTYNDTTGYYTITNDVSNRVLDVAGGQGYKGCNVQQYDSFYGWGQQWQVVRDGSTYRMFSASNGLALDLAGNSWSNGANMQLWTPNGTRAQSFILKSTSVHNNGVVSLFNGSYVAKVSGASTSSGAAIQLYSYNNTLAQKYYLRRVSGYDDVFEIESVIDGLLLSTRRDTVLRQLARGDSSAVVQNWRLVPAWNGCYFLVSADGSLAIDVAGGSRYDGNRIQGYTPNKTEAQLWGVTSVAVFHSGTYSLKASSGQALEIAGASTSNGADARLWKSNGTAAQKWSFVDLGNGYYEICNLGTGHALDICAENMRNVQQWAFSAGDKNQMWRVEYQGGGRFALISAISGLRLTLGSSAYVTGSNGSNEQKVMINDAPASYSEHLNCLVQFAKSQVGTDTNAGAVYNNQVLADGGQIIGNGYKLHCASFVYWCFKFSGNVNAFGPATAWPSDIYNHFNGYGLVGSKAEVGDICLYDYYESRERMASHATIVFATDSRGAWLVDGNWWTGNGKVCIHRVEYGEYNLRGFAHPLYQWSA